MPLIPKSHDDISKNWPKNDRLPVVSVIVPTFNHVDYISNAINSILMQETNFPFEIIIHDDASSDGTAAIISNFVNEFPGIVHAILRTENIYSKGYKIPPLVIPHTTGKYLAFCEGDDYWTDPKKLQKQVAILEELHDVFICGHWVTNVDSTGALTTTQTLTGNHLSGFFSIKDSLYGSALHPNSWLYRRIDWSNESNFELLNRLPAGDDPSMLIFLTKGQGFCIPEYLSAYRLHTGGTWSTLDKFVKSFKMLQFNIAAYKIVSINYYISALIPLSSRSFHFVLDMVAFVLKNKPSTSCEKLYSLFKHQKTLRFYHSAIVLSFAFIYPAIYAARKSHLLARKFFKS